VLIFYNLKEPRVEKEGKRRGERGGEEMRSHDLFTFTSRTKSQVGEKKKKEEKGVEGETHPAHLFLVLFSRCHDVMELEGGKKKKKGGEKHTADVIASIWIITVTRMASDLGQRGDMRDKREQKKEREDAPAFSLSFENGPLLYGWEKEGKKRRGEGRACLTSASIFSTSLFPRVEGSWH